MHADSFPDSVTSKLLTGAAQGLDHRCWEQLSLRTVGRGSHGLDGIESKDKVIVS